MLVLAIVKEFSSGISLRLGLLFSPGPVALSLVKHKAMEPNLMKRKMIIQATNLRLSLWEFAGFIKTGYSDVTRRNPMQAQMVSRTNK